MSATTREWAPGDDPWDADGEPEAQPPTPSLAEDYWSRTDDDACVDCGRDGTLPTGTDDRPRCAACAQTYYREGRF